GMHRSQWLCTLRLLVVALRPGPPRFPYTTLFRSALGKTERAAFLSRVLGYERLREAQERVREVRNGVAAEVRGLEAGLKTPHLRDRKSTRLNSSHQIISYAVFCLKKKRRNTLNRH